MYFIATSDVNEFYTVEVLFIKKITFYFENGKVLIFSGKYLVSMPSKFVLFAFYSIFVFYSLCFASMNRLVLFRLFYFGLLLSLKRLFFDIADIIAL
jgi:hypothetical protein